MNHDQMKEKIYQYHDKELSPADCSMVEDHLKECSQCRNELSDWKKLSSTFFAPSPTAKYSEKFVAGVMAQIPRVTESLPGAWGLNVIWNWSFAGMSLAVLVMPLLLSMRSKEDILNLFLANGRITSSTHWVMNSDSIEEDEFYRYTLEEQP